MVELKLPTLVTPVPGPKARSVVARSRKALTPSLPHAYPLAVRRAWGMTVEDVDGTSSSIAPPASLSAPPATAILE